MSARPRAMLAGLLDAGLPAAAVVVFALSAGSASAAAYRCTVDGKVTYSDQPCATGAQRTVELADPHVPPAERATAADRARADRAALDDIDHRHATELAEDRRAAALAARRDSERSRQARACDKLARTVRRTHDDFDVAGPREQPKARLRMQRADQDFAALCRTRR